MTVIDRMDKIIKDLMSFTPFLEILPPGVKIS
jgi:hypothetical protein